MKVSLNIPIDDSLRAKLKAKAALDGKKLHELIAELLQAALGPTEVTK